MKCINCGAELSAGALFCRKCGTAVPITPQPAPKKKRGNRKPSANWAAESRKKEPAAFEWPGTAREKEPAASEWPGTAREKEPAASEWPAVSEPVRQEPVRLKAQPAVSEPLASNPQTGRAKRRTGLRKSRLLLIGAAALVVLIAVIVIVAAASCKKTSAAFQTPEEVGDAVIAALNDGDGETLAKLAKLSEPVLGAHPETFGGGDSPEAVMRGYYATLAGDLNARLSEAYGDSYKLTGQLHTEYRTGTEIFEENRALGIEAEQYAVLSGPLSAGGETVTNVRIVVVELDGAWKLLVVYLYE